MIDDHREYGLQIGVVTERIDPKGLGRIQCRIPNKHEPHGPWCLPLGGGGGSAQQGGHVIPQIGAEVGIFFKDGNPEYPYYLAANFGVIDAGSEMPTPVLALQPKEIPDVAVFEFGDYYLAIDARKDDSGKPIGGFKIVNKATGDLIEHNLPSLGWRIHGSTIVNISADVRVNIDAAEITINKRIVATSPKVI